MASSDAAAQRDSQARVARRAGARGPRSASEARSARSGELEQLAVEHPLALSRARPWQMSPTGVSSETGSWAILRIWTMRSGVVSIRAASSSGVGSRWSSCISWRWMRCSLLIVSTMCTGTRIVRGLVGDAARDRLADPPGRVGRELVAGAPVVLLDGAHEADVAFLDEVEEEHAAADVAFRDRHHETQVGLDQLAPRGQVVALDALGERDLLGGGEQRHTADLAQVGAHRIGARWRTVASSSSSRDDLEAVGVARHAGRGELTAEPDAPAPAGALVHLDARHDEAGRRKPAPEQIGIEPRAVHAVGRGEDRAAQPHGGALGRHFVLSFRRCLVREERLEGSERLLVRIRRSPATPPRRRVARARGCRRGGGRRPCAVGDRRARAPGRASTRPRGTCPAAARAR